MRQSSPPRYLGDYLREDRSARDVTSLATIPADLLARGTLEVQAPGVVSGIEAAVALAKRSGLAVRFRNRDGTRVQAGQALLVVQGPARKVLSVERTLVNLTMHLSGVATATALLVDRARAANPAFRIAATRKTTPGLRDLEKAAVVHGGGEPHRRDLSSAILVKGNHEALVGFEQAVLRASAYARRHRLTLMIEVASTEEARSAAQAGAHRILVDNVPPAGVRKICRALEELGLRDRVEVEATGGISLSNVAKFARSGADLASVGEITHSARGLRMHLVVRPLT